MKKIIAFLISSVFFAMAHAASYVYDFRNTSVSHALTTFAEEHPEVCLNFIYNELDRYMISSKINTEDVRSALKQIIGLNPISLINENGCWYIEALQHGRYCYSGKVVGTDNLAVEAATVLLLAPKDSTVITYGITDSEGKFNIPCDRSKVIGKISCLGHNTIYRSFDVFSVGTIILPELAVALGEVKVKADAAAMYDDKTVYIPNARQRNASNSAFDLLRRMAIPQINVSSIHSEVTDNAGKQVKIFLNGIPAMKEEMDGLRTADVKKIEYLEYPSDARFQGAERVINIITQRYVFGGYSKITVKEGFLTGLQNREEVYSAFSYGKMHYGLYAALDNSNTHLGGVDSQEIFELNDGGDSYSVVRNEKVAKFRNRTDRYPVTFQATYNSDKVQVRNAFSVSHVSAQENSEGSLTLHDLKENQNTCFLRSQPNRTNNLSYSGYQFYVLPKDFSISLTPEFTYSHIDDSYVYEVDDSAVADRTAKEDAYKCALDLYADKSFGGRNSIGAFFWGEATINRLHYSGDVSYDDRFFRMYHSYGARYSFNGNPWYISADAGLSGRISEINGKRISEIGSFSHINLSYVMNRKQGVSLYFCHASGAPTVSMKSTDVLRSNEYLYITGNPDLKTTTKVWSDINYTNLFSDLFWFSAYCAYEGAFKTFVYSYDPYADGNAVIRNIINRGTNHKGNMGMKLRFNLLNNDLRLVMNPSIDIYCSKGFYNNRCVAPGLSFDAEYYLGNFNFQAYCQLKEKELEYSSNTISESRAYYYLSAGWSNSSWNVRLMAYNLFNRGRVDYEKHQVASLYSRTVTDYGGVFHPKLSLSIVYTIGYGKKIKRENEVGEKSGVDSAIIR
ncbi:MAG: carboxypeptidase-like regulatory domain-containing protein [Muribaculaceae bacterium]|nr:carboxypeptidase-like regulatory domain-containing protein [Muribaculaceae bacterium]